MAPSAEPWPDWKDPTTVRVAFASATVAVAVIGGVAIEGLVVIGILIVLLLLFLPLMLYLLVVKTRVMSILGGLGMFALIVGVHLGFVVESQAGSSTAGFVYSYVIFVGLPFAIVLVLVDDRLTKRKRRPGPG